MGFAVVGGGGPIGLRRVPYCTNVHMLRCATPSMCARVKTNTKGISMKNVVKTHAN